MGVGKGTGRGGARAGSGRKPGGYVIRTIKIPPDLWEAARVLGEGVAAEGIRRALRISGFIRDHGGEAS